MLSEFLFHLLPLPFCMGLYSVRFSMSLDVTSGLYWSLCCPSFYVTWSHSRSVWVSMLSECLCHLFSLPFCMGLYVVRVSISLGLASVLYESLCCSSFYFTCSLYRFVLVSILSDFLCHLMSPPVCIGLYVVRVSMSLGLTHVLYGSLCCPSFYVTWFHSRSVWISILFEFLCHLVSLPFCMDLYVVRVSISLGLASVLYGSLCCSSFYFTCSLYRFVWVSILSDFLCHLMSPTVCIGLYVVRVSMSLGLTHVLYGSLCCPSFYVTWFHSRSVWISILFEFLCHLVSLPFCMDLYVVRVSISLGLASVLYGSLCCSSFYFTCSLYRFVWVSILSDFLCHLTSPTSVLVFMLSEFLCHLVSLPFCMGLYVVRVSMSLVLTPVLYGFLCCPSFYVTWSHFRYVWFFMFSKFLCHLISLPFCMGLYFVRFSMSLNFTSVLYVLLCCPNFQVTWSHFRFVWFSMLSEFLYWFSFIFMFVIVLIIMADRSFLAHLAKGNVSICHHLASVVR
jgi:hypothetical protein